MKTEKVSIVTPCYNGEKYLERFLKSILNQSYGNIELIFINDGSTDQTEEIIKKYKEEFDLHNRINIFVSGKCGTGCSFK